MSEETDRDTETIPLETEDGETVVIHQQNAGPGNQVGGGEFKNSTGRTVEEAAAEQSDLELEAPSDSDS